MGMSTFGKKGVWHSDLTRETDASSLTVRIKGDPRPSKYPNKPDYVFFEVMGDDEEYSYSVENESCAEAIRGAPKNAWIEMKAAGSRDVATLWFGPSDVEDAPPPTNGSGNGAAQPVSNGHGNTPRNGNGVSKPAAVYLAALEAANEAVDAFHQNHGHMPSDEAIRIATTIYIQSNR